MFYLCVYFNFSFCVLYNKFKVYLFRQQKKNTMGRPKKYINMKFKIAEFSNDDNLKCYIVIKSDINF